MKHTLTSSQSVQWQQGDPDAWQIELSVLRWARAQHITETVVVLLSNGLRAFSFRLDAQGNLGEEEDDAPVPPA